MLGVVMTAAVLALAGAAETTAPPAPTGEAAAAPAKAKAAKSRVVCKESAPTGTRFTKTRCMTEAQYKRLQEEERRAYEEVQNRPNISTARGN